MEAYMQAEPDCVKRYVNLLTLFAAASCGDAKLVANLIPVCDAKAADRYGWPALHHAARHGRIECARILLASADISARTWTTARETAFDLAARHKHEECAALIGSVMEHALLEAETTEGRPSPLLSSSIRI